MPRRRSRAVLAAAGAATLAITLAAGLAGPAAASNGSAVTGHGRGGPDDGPTRLYVPDPNPGAYDQFFDLLRHGQWRDAAGLARMMSTPQSVWLTGQEGVDPKRQARDIVRDAARQRALPVLSLYNVPGRDCAQYSAGGAANTAEYKEWVDGVVEGIGNKPALVILEPDSLALLPSDCGQDDAEGTLTTARYEELNYAVDQLTELPRVKVYLDAGHSGWHSVNDLVPRLIEAGVAETEGFYLNTSNYRTDEELSAYGTLISGCLSYAEEGGDPADCPNQWWPAEDAQGWLDENVTTDPADQPHFVTDTSRNGQGPWTPPEGVYSDPQDWCNPPDRGLGLRPTLRTGDPLIDAHLWIKIPGESDGLCLRGTEGPEDPERGYELPAAGQWFPQQALELVEFADPPVFGR